MWWRRMAASAASASMSAEKNVQWSKSITELLMDRYREIVPDAE
jgi:hypothetical protein